MNDDPPESTLQEGFCLNGWDVEPALNRIIGNDEAVQVEPKVMQVLVCLAEHPGDVLSREDLMETVWPDTLGSDDLLTRCVSELRKVFDDDPKDPQVIETIRKRGYRLMVPVSPSMRRPAPRNGAEASDPHVGRPRRRTWLARAAGLTGLVVLLIGGFIGYWLSGSAPSATPKEQAVPLTSFPGEERDAAFSPDGNQVAFVWQPDDGDNYDLFTKLVGTEQPLRLTRTPEMERSPTWSPDGRQIAFIRHTAGDCGLFLISALGHAERQLTACAPDVNAGLSWSPDGRWLALSERATAQEPYRLVLLSVETLERRTLSAPPASYRGDRNPVFSPDGQTLAFVRNVNGWAGYLFLVPVAGGAERQLTAEGRDIVGHDWAADGNSLVFASNLGGDYGLWRVSLSGGAPRYLQTAGLKRKHPVLSRHGALLAYESWEYDINIWRMPLSAAAPAPTRIVSSTLWDMHPQVSPDGARVAFTSTRSGHFEIWVSDADGAHPVQVSSFDGPFAGTPRWAPDARRLVFDARPDGDADLYVVDVAAKTPIRLTASPSNDLAPSWSHDGRWIYFASDRSGTWEVWKMPSAGGDAVQVTRHGGFAAFESPDGATLYFTKQGVRGLWGLPVGGGEETLVLDQLDPEHWGHWAVVGRAIYFLQTAQPSGVTLARYDLDTGQVASLGHLEQFPGSLDFAVSSDGQWVFYTRTDRSESDLMLVTDFR